MSIQSFPSLPMDTGYDRLTQKGEAFQASLNNAGAGPGGEEDFEKAAREFESFFLYYLIKVMRDTVQESGLFGERKAEKIYRSMQDEQLAQVLAQRGGLGLGEMIQRDLGVKSRGQALEALVRPVPNQGASPLRNSEKQALELDIDGRVTSGFGRRVHPVTGEFKKHEGVDFALPLGSPVFAAGDGEVVFSGTMKGYGNVMILRHPGDLETVYAHHETNERPEGARVQKGEIIGRVGMTGMATGPHLHFEVRKSGVPVDPQQYVECRHQ